MKNDKINRRGRLPALAGGLGALALASSTALAQVDVGVFVDKTALSAGEAGPTVSVSAHASTQTAVDVYVGLIGPGGTIYTFPGFQASLTPWLQNVVLPAGFTYPPTFTFSADSFPSGLSAGVWKAAVAVTQAGTMNFLDIAVAPFQVVDGVATPGTGQGFITVARQQSAGGATLSANGVFVEINGSLSDLQSTYTGQEPGLDECVFNELPIDFSGIPQFDVRSLDAGPALKLNSAGWGVIDLPKDPASASAGFIQYMADNPPLQAYQDNVTYTVSGPGGPEVGPFSASLVAPPALTLVQPAMAAIATHDAATPLQLQWQGNNGVGEVEVSLSGSDLSAVYVIDCRFADDGTGTIPANLVTQLKNGLESGGTTIPLPDFELPGFELPGLGAQATLDVSRVAYTMFDANSLDVGFFVMSTGATLNVTLE